MMNRRQFTAAITQTLISLAGLAGMGVGAVAVVKCRKKPMARLLNNEKGVWYNGARGGSDIAQGDDLLLYEPENTSQQHLASWHKQIAELVESEYAEYL